MYKREGRKKEGKTQNITKFNTLCREHSETIVFEEVLTTCMGNSGICSGNSTKLLPKCEEAKENTNSRRYIYASVIGRING